MYCKHCGKQIADDSIFCNNCGTRQASGAQIQTVFQPVGRICPRCGQHNVQYQTVTESRKTGCFTVLLYIFLACTILGLLIVIPLVLRKKTNTVTYAVCQNCGCRWKI